MLLFSLFCNHPTQPKKGMAIRTCIVELSQTIRFSPFFFINNTISCLSRALLSQKPWKVYPGSFSIPLLSVSLPCCHKQSVPFRALRNPRPFPLCCRGVQSLTGVKVSARTGGLYDFTLKAGIKHISYQTVLPRGSCN